jgi:hypothetical protein
MLKPVDHLLSLDLAYSVTGLMNQGWGIGLSYMVWINCISAWVAAVIL